MMTCSTVYLSISGRVLIVAESRVVWIGEESFRYAAGAKIKTLQTRNVLIFAVAAYVYFFPFSSILPPILAICFQFYVVFTLGSQPRRRVMGILRNGIFRANRDSVKSMTSSM